jgi:hypothetical protein
MSKELEAWLSKLSLEQYAPAFRANAIDIAVLADLTDIDLIELGVTPLGHRKRLLSAIENLRQSRFKATPNTRGQAERRQVGRAQKIAEHTGEFAHLAQVFRLRGSIEAADRSSNMRAARAFYERAIEFARPRGLRPLVAQCLAGMAEAWHVEGDVVTAADYKAQAQLVFDELKVLSSPSL